MRSVRWSVNVTKWDPTEAEFFLASSCLQTEEKTRIGKFVFKKDVKASLAGRLLIRKFINEYAGVPYTSIELSRDTNGKPIYEPKNSRKLSVSFNVSHHGSFTVFAGECDQIDIGVDVMKLEYSGGKTLNEFFHVMSRNFSLLEWNNINGPPHTTEEEKIRMFCRNWALKESYIKATGLGLKMDLCQLNFDIDKNLDPGCITTSTSLFINNIKQAWIFEESLIDSSHCVAVAIKRANCQEYTTKSNLVFKELTPSNLLENAVPLLPLDIEYCNNFFNKA